MDSLTILIGLIGFWNSFLPEKNLAKDIKLEMPNEYKNSSSTAHSSELSISKYYCAPNEEPHSTGSNGESQTEEHCWSKKSG